jgi:vacuolar iron transporter family protein
MLSIVMQGINGFSMGRVEIEKRFLKGEILDNAVYLALARGEKDRELRSLLLRLADEEKGHIAIWRSLLGRDGEGVRGPAFLKLRVLSHVLVKRVLGIAFTTKLLERNETGAIASYGDILRKGALGPGGRAYLNKVIGEEEGHESSLAAELAKHKGDLDYTESTILGLNDGLVEILAVIAGLAAVATGGFIVAVIGMIAGISGTLSMAGGVYLSSKSENLVKAGRGEKKDDKKVQPIKAAYHCGIYYFLGALIAVLPFLFGLSGAAGIAISIILVCATLVFASAIVAITSGTSVKGRAFEMLAISLGAAFVTILFGTFARVYFGVSI